MNFRLRDIKITMRTLFFIFLTILAIFPPQGTSQIKKVEGVYLGHLEDGYSFCVKTTMDMEEIVVFDEILSIILEKYPLHEDKHIGENFIISFVESEMTMDNGSIEKSTIIRLQKLLPGQHLKR